MKYIKKVLKTFKEMYLTYEGGLIVFSILIISLIVHESVHYVDLVMISGEEFINICFIGYKEGLKGWLVTQDLPSESFLRIEGLAYLIQSIAAIIMVAVYTIRKLRKE